MRLEGLCGRREGDLDDGLPRGLPQRGGKQDRPPTLAAHPIRPRSLLRAKSGAVRALEVGEAALQPSPGHQRRQVLGPRPRSIRLRTGTSTS